MYGYNNIPVLLYRVYYITCLCFSVPQFPSGPWRIRHRILSDIPTEKAKSHRLLSVRQLGPAEQMTRDRRRPFNRPKNFASRQILQVCDIAEVQSDTDGAWRCVHRERNPAALMAPPMSRPRAETEQLHGAHIAKDALGLMISKWVTKKVTSIQVVSIFFVFGTVGISFDWY